jgi:hypothetical protein
MRRAALISTLVIAGAALAGAPNVSAESGDSPHDVCSMPGTVGDGEEDLFRKAGGCVSIVATNGGFSFDAVITQAGYTQRGKALEALLGGYPMVFVHGSRVDIAENKQECIELLRFFHGGGLGEE